MSAIDAGCNLKNLAQNLNDVGVNMHKDRYQSFGALSRVEVEGDDFGIVSEDRGSKYLIIAPHGGFIEPGTSEISRAVAGEDYSLYIFEGLRNRPFRDLHITSTSFDEPKALGMAAKSERVVAIHGRADNGDGDTIWLGGLDAELVSLIETRLIEAGFRVLIAKNELAGTHRENICNRGQLGKGVQLELPRSLRNDLISDTAKMARFTEELRQAVVTV